MLTHDFFFFTVLYARDTEMPRLFRNFSLTCCQRQDWDAKKAQTYRAVSGLPDPLQYHTRISMEWAPLSVSNRFTIRDDLGQTFSRHLRDLYHNLREKSQRFGIGSKSVAHKDGLLSKRVCCDDGVAIIRSQSRKDLAMLLPVYQ